MIDPKYIDLINQELDGMNDDNESVEIKEYLSANSEARKLFHDLSITFKILNNAQESELSPNLKRIIINSLPNHNYKPKEVTNMVKSLLPFGQLGVKLRYLFVFALGVIVGIIGLTLLNPNFSKDSSPLESEILGSVILGGKQLDLQVSDNAEVNLDQLHGTVQIKRSETIILAKLDIKSETPVDVLFEFDGNNISFGGYNITDVNPSEFKVGENFVKLQGVNQNKGVMIFRTQNQLSQSIKFKILSSETTLYEQDLSIGVSS